MKDFLECTALITGASAGIGREIARQLAPLANTIILVARRTDRLEQVRAELLEINPALRVQCETVDLSRLDEAEALCQRLRENGTELDFLVNNAGLGDRGLFEDSDWAKVERMLQVNVVALTALCHGLIPVLRRHRPGAILNVSSIASMLPLPDMAVYAASKAYVSSFSEALRAELRGTGISVTHVCPGPVETEFGTVAAREGSPEAVMPAIVQTPVEEVARVALRAVSRDHARAVPGLLMIVGALTLGIVPLVILRLFLKPGPRQEPQALRAV
jgi:short-subunit dehydrogenase